MLGKGTYSVVRKGINLQTKEEVAVKCIDEKMLSEKDIKALQREVRILKHLKHSNIISFKGFYQDKKSAMFFIVTEYCGGGELFDAIVAKTYYDETATRQMMRPLIDAVRYLHVRNVTHRDLKPENILLSLPHKNGKVDVSSLKLADFGFAFQHSQAIHPDHQRLQTVCGSPIYVAPEILRHHEASLTQKKLKQSDQKTSEKTPGYRSKGVDVWSLGIIMYILLCGYPPFLDASHSTQSNEVLFDKIKRGSFEFDPKYWNHISPEAKDLLRKMLNSDPKKRYSIQQVIRHAWFLENSANSTAVSVSRTKRVTVKGWSVGQKFGSLKNAVTKLRFLSISSSGSISMRTDKS